ncbi:glycosyltransferase [Actinokineospora enzanensis]|uniref:glycosyltransferase n=1 Tax=Actinokineospora enzanensis TaxID=155975 RepID=UPI00036BEE17|nr:glycosyltransferase [Actinokineospora enzanensis]
MSGLRVLFTTQPAGGHLRPLVPLAAALRGRGHEVAVCAAETLAADVAAYGLDHVPGGYDWSREIWQLLPKDFPRLPPEEARAATEALAPRIVTEVFAGPVALALARDVLRLAGSWRPDLVVREVGEFGGYLAAEALGVPHVSVASGSEMDLLVGERLGPRLADHRVALGLSADVRGESLYRHLHVSFLPPAYGDSELVLPNTRCYRHEHSAHRGERLPEWLAEADPARPFVYAALGTSTGRLPVAERLTSTILEVVGALDCTAMVVVGEDPERFGPQQAHVHAVARSPQALVLESADLFVTHAGFNGMKEALRCGVPMVAVPLTADQPRIAARCAELGVARLLPPSSVTAGSLRAACVEVLDDPRYRARGRALRRHMLALPSVDDLADDLAALVS